MADASRCSIGVVQDEDKLTLKANKVTTAPDLILNRWPSPRGAGPAKRSCMITRCHACIVYTLVKRQCMVDCNTEAFHRL
jgi:hypothetical protein